MSRRANWPDKRQLRRMRRRHQLRVRERERSAVVSFNAPGRSIRSLSDLTMELETGLKVRMAATRVFAQTHYRAMSFGHGRIVADDGTIVTF